MTDAELDAIEKRADLAWYDGDDHRTCNQQILALVAEVRRLRLAYEPVWTVPEVAAVDAPATERVLRDALDRVDAQIEEHKRGA